MKTYTFICTECQGKHEPCVLEVISSDTVTQKPDKCPFPLNNSGVEAKWKEDK